MEYTKGSNQEVNIIKLCVNSKKLSNSTIRQSFPYIFIKISTV